MSCTISRVFGWNTNFSHNVTGTSSRPIRIVVSRDHPCTGWVGFRLCPSVISLRLYLYTTLFIKELNIYTDCTFSFTTARLCAITSHVIFWQHNVQHVKCEKTVDFGPNFFFPTLAELIQLTNQTILNIKNK